MYYRMARVAAAACMLAAIGASRSQIENEATGEEAANVWPRLVQPQPLYVELPIHVSARKRDPQDPSLPVPLLLAADISLTGGCLKLITFNAEAAVPSYDSVFARVNGSNLVDHLTLSIASASIKDARFQRVFVGTGKEVPVLAVFCDAALEEVVSEVEVSFKWTGAVPSEDGTTVSTDKREGSATVHRTVPDVDASEPVSSDAARPVVGLCAHFALDASVGSGWPAYWTALGVDRIVLYFNGRFDALEEGEAKTVRELLASSPSITLVEWPFPYAFRTDGGNGTDPSAFVFAAAPMAATHCAHSYGSAVDFLLFADSKDYGVVPPAPTGTSESLPPLQRMFTDVTARYGPAAAGVSGSGGGIDVVGIPSFWAATLPSAQTSAGVEMGLDAETAERVRGDLYSLAFLRSGPTLRHEVPAAGEAKYAVTRAAVGSLGLLCTHSPCRAQGAGPRPLVEVNITAADGYSLRLLNAGVPVTMAHDLPAHAKLVVGATVLDEGFRANLRSAAAKAGLLARAPATASATPIPTCAATAGVGEVPPPVARLHAELAKTQMHCDCDHEHRRFLVFAYGAEQGINGFAAMFQFYAAALALAHASGRTFVELLPPPLVSASSNGSLAVDSANGTAGGSRYSSRQSLYDATAEYDPWRRAPPHACRGAKMGCFFAQHASCAATGVLASALPAFDFPGEMRRQGRATTHPYRKTAAGSDLSGSESSAVGGGTLPPSRAHKKKFGSALARAVRVESIAGVRGALLAATRGDFAPAWFRQSAADWACGRCSTGSLQALGNGSSNSGCGSQDAAALEDHCSTYCSGGPDKAWRALWFPALESWLFRPSESIVNATADAVAKVTSPARSRIDLPLEPSTATVGLHASGSAAAVRVAATADGASSTVAVDAATGAATPAVVGTSASDVAAGTTGWRAPHVAVGIHYRAGDATGLVWRSHAPLTAYLQAAHSLVLGLDKRARQLAAEHDSPAVASRLTASNDTAVHVSLALATDSAAAREALRGLVYDRLAGHDAPIFDSATNRTSALASSGAGGSAENVTAAEPLLSLLDSGAHALIEGEERARTVAGVLRNMLRAKLWPGKGGVHFHRLVTTGAPLLSKEAPPPADAANSSAASGNTTGAASASPSPAAAGAPNATSDRVVHIESYISGVLEGAKPKILMGGDEGADDDVYPSKEPGDVRVVRVSPASYGPWRGRLSPSESPADEFEETQAAAAREVAGLTEGVVADIWTLSHANYLIGTCLSQVSRLAFELQYAAGRARAHPVGLDARLCRAFPMPAPYTITADWREVHDVWVGDED